MFPEARRSEPLDGKVVELVFHLPVQFAEMFKVFPDGRMIGKMNVIDGDRVVLRKAGQELFVFFDPVFDIADMIALQIEAILEGFHAGLHFVVRIFGNDLAEAFLQDIQFFLVKIQFVAPQTMFVVKIGEVCEVLSSSICHIILIFK